MMAEVLARTSFRRTIVRRAVLGVMALSAWVSSAAYASQFGAAFVPKAPEPVEIPAAAEPEPQPEPKYPSQDESSEPAPV